VDNSLKSYPSFPQLKKNIIQYKKNRQHPGKRVYIYFPKKQTLKARRLPMWKSIVTKQMRYNRNIEVRKKVNLFFEADRLKNVSLACKKLGFTRSFYYDWWNRLNQSDWNISSLEKRSTKPKSHPKTTKAEKVELIKKLRIQTGYGPERIAYYLEKDHNVTMPLSTIGHILKREGLIAVKPKKNQKKHTKRYEMPNPGDMVQMDVKYVPYLIRGERYYQFTAIDDCSRWRFADIYPEKSTYSTKDFVTRLLREAPFSIRCIQTDGGTEFTNIYVSDPKCILKKPKVHVLDKICAKNNIRHKLIPPSTPQINGKVERSHRIDEEEFYRLEQYKDYKTLRNKFLAWNNKYNYQRPHGGIKMQTPAEKLRKKLEAYNKSLPVVIEKLAA
jgi:transposase InsO family protein